MGYKSATHIDVATLASVSRYQDVLNAILREMTVSPVQMVKLMSQDGLKSTLVPQAVPRVLVPEVMGGIIPVIG
jgi:D-ribose pyranose/furanose isomerase RbsD